MRIFLAVLPVVFAAFCIWLGVRITNRRERWAKWLVIVVAATLAYPLSFGPACWITTRIDLGASSIQVIYRPIYSTMSYAPVPISSAIRWYVNALSANNWLLGIGEDDKWTWSQVVPFNGVTETILH